MEKQSKPKAKETTNQVAVVKEIAPESDVVNQVQEVLALIKTQIQQHWPVHNPSSPASVQPPHSRTFHNNNSKEYNKNRSACYFCFKPGHR